jgi:hypothetical protein
MMLLLLFPSLSVTALLAPMEGVARIEAHPLVVLLLQLVAVPAARGEAGAGLERSGRHAVVPAVGQPAARGAAAAAVVGLVTTSLMLVGVGLSLSEQGVCPHPTVQSQARVLKARQLKFGMHSGQKTELQ